MEVWKIIDNFDNYSISNYGNVRNNKKHLGCFINIEDAANAYQEAKNKYHIII